MYIHLDSPSHFSISQPLHSVNPETRTNAPGHRKRGCDRPGGSFAVLREARRSSGDRGQGDDAKPGHAGPAALEAAAPARPGTVESLDWRPVPISDCHGLNTDTRILILSHGSKKAPTSHAERSLAFGCQAYKIYDSRFSWPLAICECENEFHYGELICCSSSRPCQRVYGLQTDRIQSSHFCRS